MKLSIITINLNNSAGLRKTMESVLSQTYRDFEYIVVDGASTDGSVDVIKEYVRKVESGESRLKSVIWSSEPDSGIYDAMNRGVRKATGEYVLMLNSGDYLVDENVIERIMTELDGTDIVQGNNIEERAKGVYRNRGYGKSDIDLFDVMKGHFLHQASFCKRDLFERFGYFDETYKMGADTKFFMISLGQNDATFKYVNIDIVNYDMSGISAARFGKWAECREKELKRVRKEVFSDRAFTFMLENDKKIRLYNNLHAHNWTWCLTMIVAHIRSWIYGYTSECKEEKIIK